MSRPLRRGRLDILDRLHPGLADRTRALAAAVPGSLRPAPARARSAGLDAATAAVRDGPAAAALEAALDAHQRWPGPVADRLVVVAAGRVRAGGGPAPVAPALVGVPADEAARLADRLVSPVAS